MSDKTQIMESIKEAFENMHKNPSIYKKKILTYIFDLRAKEEYQDLSDSEVYDIVEEAFKLNPENFMKHVYYDLRKKFSKRYGDEKLKEMEKYILEKYYFHEGEQIFFEFNGNIVQNRKMTQPIFLRSASIFFTNDRFIAQGKLEGSWRLYIIYSPELAVYGYVFPFKNAFKLRKSSIYDIKYRVMVDNRPSEIMITILAKPQTKRKELTNKLFEMLSKEIIEESPSKPEEDDESS